MGRISPSRTHNPINSVVRMLSEDYYSIFMLNLATGESTSVRLHMSDRAIGHMVGRISHYELLRRYIDTMVHPDDRRNSLAAGMDDYLAKPIDGVRLKAAVARFRA